MKYKIKKLKDKINIEFSFDRTSKFNYVLDKLSKRFIKIEYNKSWEGPGGIVSIYNKYEYDIFIKIMEEVSELNIKQIANNVEDKMNKMYPESKWIETNLVIQESNYNNELNEIIKDRIPYKLGENIENIIEFNLAKIIDSDYINILKGEELILLSVLDGSFMFASDLMRSLLTPVRLGFMKLSSYGNKLTSTDNVELIMGATIDVYNKHVLVLEDICDTGNTWGFISNYLENKNVKTYRLCALMTKSLFNPIFCDKQLEPYYGFVCDENDFLVGYGMDYKGVGRGLRDIYCINKSVFKE